MSEKIHFEPTWEFPNPFYKADGRNIGLMIIAEGVRTKAEFDTLKDLGFDGATGPWIKFPEPPQPTE